MWYVQPAKPQIRLRIHTVRLEPLLVSQYSINIKLLTKHHLEFLNLQGGS